MNIRDRMALAIHHIWCGQGDDCTRVMPSDQWSADAALSVLDDPDVIAAIDRAYHVVCDESRCDGYCGARAVVALLQGKQP